MFATILICGVGIFLGLDDYCDFENYCQPRFASFLNASPNEIGDTLAGFASALAFIWIIVTVLLQSKELASQREELGLTRREFERMAEAQAKQVEQMHFQSQILQRQAQSADEIEAGKTAESLLSSFFDKLRTQFSEGISVPVASGKVETFSLFDLMQHRPPPGFGLKSLNDKKILELISSAAARAREIAIGNHGEYPFELITVSDDLERVIYWLSKADTKTQKKFEPLKLSVYAEILRKNQPATK